MFRRLHVESMKSRGNEADIRNENTETGNTSYPQHSQRHNASNEN